MIKYIIYICTLSLLVAHIFAIITLLKYVIKNKTPRTIDHYILAKGPFINWFILIAYRFNCEEVLYFYAKIFMFVLGIIGFASLRSLKKELDSTLGVAYELSEISAYKVELKKHYFLLGIYSISTVCFWLTLIGQYLCI